HDYRQQEYLGEDDHQHTDTGADRQIPDDTDIDHQQGGKPHYIAQQSDRAGHEQKPEGRLRGLDAGKPPQTLRHHGVDVLDGVADTDRERQERHQRGVRVKRIAHQPYYPQLPQHRQAATEDHRRGAAPAARIQVQQSDRQHEGNGEKQRHVAHALDQITHDLGEAGNMDTDTLTGIFVAHQLLQALGKQAIVELVAGLGVQLEQRRQDHGRAVIVGHQTADSARTRHIASHLLNSLGCAIEIVRHHQTTDDAVLGHLAPEYIGCPQGLHVAAVHPGDVEHLVIDFLQCEQEVSVINITSGIFDNYSQHITRFPQVLLVGEVVLDIGVAGRDHFLKARFQLYLRGLPTKQYRHE